MMIMSSFCHIGQFRGSFGSVHRSQARATGRTERVETFVHTFARLRRQDNVRIPSRAVFEVMRCFFGMSCFVVQ